MTTLNHIISDLGPALVVFALLFLLLLAVAVMFIARRRQVESSIALKSMQNKLAQSQEKLTTLQSQAKRLTAQSFISEFRDENIYLIIAKHEIEVAGDLHTYGLVSPKNGAPKPFFTNQRMETLHVDDYFTNVRGELIKVGKKTSDDAFGLETETVSRPVSSQQLELDAEYSRTETDLAVNFGNAVDQTVLFDKALSGHKDYDERYAGFPYLRVLSGNDQGTLFYLMFDRASIGRGESCDFSIKDDNSSRVHCEIVFQNQYFVLKDNQSTNGTFCNGEQIHETALNFGDTIKVGNTEMVFSCEGFELKENDPEKAIKLFEKCLQREPNFVIALKHLAFLMERDVARQRDAKPLWERIKKLESRKSP